MFLASDSASMLAVAAGVCGAIVVASAKGGRVLFMDDEEAITMMAEKVVRRLGYDFESAADGMEAIEKYRAARNSGSPFDLVVLDLTIPGGMGGREAMAILRKEDPGVRAIVSSGYSSDMTMSTYHEHGFRGMIAKPYDIGALTAAIHAAMNDPG